jgi:hypothetical protein
MSLIEQEKQNNKALELIDWQQHQHTNTQMCNNHGKRAFFHANHFHILFSVERPISEIKKSIYRLTDRRQGTNL